MIFDAHCHIDIMQNMAEIISHANSAELGIFAVGTTPKAYVREKGMCKNCHHIRVGLGFHPQLISSGYDDLILFENNVETAQYIGEVGLDFRKEYASIRDKQIDAFERIINLCEHYGNKVVSIHSTKAIGTVLDTIKKHKQGDTNKYVLHWFTGSCAQLHKAIELGCYFSVNPCMLKTVSGKEVVKNIPESRLLVETDAPYVNEFSDIEAWVNIMKKSIIQISEIRMKDATVEIEMNSETVFKAL